MAFVEWDNALSVGIEEIDNQHKKLITMINELHDAMKERRTKDILAGIITGLISYTGEHFATEEKYFKEFSYPKTMEHEMEHKNFVKKVVDFKQDFQNGKLMLSMDIMSFLKNWLISHIQGTDRQYTEFFKENGLS